MNIRKLLALTMTLSLLLTACGGSSSAPPAPGATPSDTASVVPAQGERVIKDNINAVLKGEPSNIDPHGNLELVAFAVQTQIFDTLLRKDADGNIIPWVAKSWETIDDTTVRFFLRDDVHFHNGDKMTAEDVRFTVQRACEKPSSASIFANFDPKKTAVVDEYTIDIATKGPFASIFNYLCSTRGGIVPKGVLETVGDDAFGRDPVGTGAFKFQNWVTGTELTVARNDAFWGDKPASSSITFKFITETATRAIELESGAADIIFDPASSDMKRLSENPNLTVHVGPSFSTMQMMMNLSDPTLQDIRVRQALQYALDIPGITEAVFGEYARPADGVIADTIFSYKSYGLPEYNPDKARALLAEAGYASGLTLVMALANAKETQDTAEICQNMWNAVGINIDMKITAMQEFQASCRRGQNQVMASAANYTTGDPGHALYQYDTRGFGSSLVSPSDSKVDGMLDEGSRTYDDQARIKVYQELQDYLHDQVYIIPIADKMIMYATSNKVENFPCDPGNTPYLAGVVVYE